MASENLSQAEGQAIRRATALGARLFRIARLGLGGVMIGSFLGVYVGAMFGLGYAAWVGRLSPALDGALLGGAVFAVLGGCYGIILGWTERPGAVAASLHEPPADARESNPASRTDTPPQAPPAASLGLNQSPAMEHAHVR